MSRRVVAFGCLLVLGLLGTSGARPNVEMGHVEITVVDKATGKPVPCRVHLKDAAGKGGVEGGDPRGAAAAGLRLRGGRDRV
jgi:hypothetical protein